MDRTLLESLTRDRLIEIIVAQGQVIERLTKRVAELEARLDVPAKTPDNSSLPPSLGRKPSGLGGVAGKGRRRGKGRKGSYRALHPNPTRVLAQRASCCPHCQGDVWQAPQQLCEAYDHIDIPPVEPVVTRVHLHGGTCPGCGERFKASAPVDMPPGSPFGGNLRAFVIYLRYTQGIGFERLSRLLHDLFGLTISEGALANMLGAASPAFAAQTQRIRSQLLSHNILASDETGMRVGKRNFWMWVFHHGDSAIFRTDPSRSKKAPQAFLGGHRPDFWLSDRYGAQKGFAAKGHQFCLAHLIRDAQYAVDAGDDVFAPGLVSLFKRACNIGSERQNLTDRQLAFHHKKCVKKLSQLMAKRPTQAEGVKLHEAIGKIRRNLFLFLTNRHIEPTNNGSERALRPCVTFRKITNGFRSEWGASLYADIRSVVETARRRGISALHAIRLTLRTQPLPLNPA
jgi:transposase